MTCRPAAGTPTALLAGTTEVGAHPPHTAHTAHRKPVSSNPNPAAICAAMAVAVNRDDALTNDVVRGTTYSASLNAAVNDTHPANASVAVAVHRDTALTDDVDRNAACAANPASYLLL